MSAFASDGQVPEWLEEHFDKTTSLPKGPLEYLPVPLEGQITSARVSSPKSNLDREWLVTVECAESPDEALRFYEEYLPLSGYEIVAVGSFRTRKGWLGPKTKAHLLVARRDQYIGKLTFKSLQTTHTTVEIEMGHQADENYCLLADDASLRQRTDVKWRG